MAMKGREARNEVLRKLMPLLWHGLTDAGIVFLLQVSTDYPVKSKKILDELIEYLNRNKSDIPCYTIRKRLGLCNSSALGEKMNDLIVSKRQKNDGMSWSKEGSVALATVTALKRNKEHDFWFRERKLAFKLAA